MAVDDRRPIPYEDLGRLNQPLVEEMTAAFRRVAEKGWFILGDEVDAFEAEFARYVGAEYCVGVGSGLDALVLTLDALELPKNSEVIVAANSYIATIMAVLRCGLVPVLAEPDEHTCNIDPRCIEAEITPQTRAVCITHLYGRPCDMPTICDIAAAHDLRIIEDCAQAHGATVHGQAVGTFGTGAFSFYPTKNLGALGDGGAVTTSDPRLYERIRSLRNYGSTRKYYNSHFGYNSRLDEIQAALLRIKLNHLDALVTHKTSLTAIYREQLPAQVELIQESLGLKAVHHIFPILTARRDELRAYLAARGIGTEVHYPVPPHRQPAMRGLLSGDYPISDRLHATVLSLPCSGIHTEADVERVCGEVRRFFGGA